MDVIAYKGMKSNMTSRNFQYEIGKTYKTDKAELCKCGFHACLNPRYVLYYYPQDEGSRYFKVKLSGEIAKCDETDTKVAATEITILEDITDKFDEVVKNIEWWKNENVLDLLLWTEGFARVQRGDKLYNFIDKNGNILSKQWFRFVYSFNDGFARIQRGDELYNFIDKQGNYLSKEWFNCAYSFNDGFARIQRGDELYNFIDKQGNYLSNEWFRYVWPFHEGFAAVKKYDRLYNYIDKNGKLLSDEWFKEIYKFNEGFARVQRISGEWHYMDENGNYFVNFKLMLKT